MSDEATRPFQVEAADLGAPDVVELLELHAAGMEANSPPGACHYFDVDALRRPDVTVWAVRDDGGRLAGVGALHVLDESHGEVKSMRTAASHLGLGVGRIMIDHVIETARSRGYERLSLETGRTDGFAAAVRLYERVGFVRCGPFGSYEPSDFSQYFTLQL